MSDRPLVTRSSLGARPVANMRPLKSARGNIHPRPKGGGMGQHASIISHVEPRAVAEPWTGFSCGYARLNQGDRNGDDRPV